MTSVCLVYNSADQLPSGQTFWKKSGRFCFVLFSVNFSILVLTCSTLQEVLSSSFDYLVSSGLLTQGRWQKTFHTEPKHFLHLRRQMEMMCVSLACMSKNMDLIAPFLTPGNDSQIMRNNAMFYKCKNLICLFLFFSLFQTCIHIIP